MAPRLGKLNRISQPRIEVSPMRADDLQLVRGALNASLNAPLKTTEPEKCRGALPPLDINGNIPACQV